MTWPRSIGLAVLVVVLCGLLTLPASGYEGTSVFDNVAPESQLQGSSVVDRYPLNRYGLDYHVTAGVQTTDLLVVKVPTDVSLTDLPALALHALTALMWDAIRLMLSITITAFTFAFSLDLINGANGALAPVSRATRGLYSDMGAWLPIGMTLVGIWALIRVSRRQYGVTLSAMLVSALYLMIAVWIVTQPMASIGQASRWTNELSNAILSELDGRANTGTGDAKTAAADRMFRDLILEPWVALEFGGLEHCVDAAGHPVKPKSRACETRIDHSQKYAQRWLRAGPANGKERSLEYKAILDGARPSDSEIDDAGMPADSFDGYRLSKADKPAVDIQQAPGVGERFTLTFGVGVASLGAAVLLGVMSFWMILMQVFALLLLAVGPFVLIFAMFPGPGHALFEAWVTRMGYALGRKVLYALLLSVILTITSAVRGATADLGWGASYGLIGLFMILVVLYHHDIYEAVERALPGGRGPGRSGVGSPGDLSGRANDSYYRAKMAGAAAGGALAVAAMPTRGGYKLGKGGYKAAGAAAGAVGLAGTGAGGLVDDRAAKGHTRRLVESAGLHAEAVRRLEDDHGKAAKRLAAEESRRAQLAALRKRAKITRKPDDEDAPQPLTDRERTQMTSLEQNAMNDSTLRGLRDSVREVEQRRRDTKGEAPFLHEQIKAREQEILAERAAANNGDPGDPAGDGGGAGGGMLVAVPSGGEDTLLFGEGSESDAADWARGEGIDPVSGLPVTQTQTQTDAQRLADAEDGGSWGAEAAAERARASNESASRLRAHLARVRPKGKPWGGAGGARDNQKPDDGGE